MSQVESPPNPAFHLAGRVALGALAVALLVAAGCSGGGEMAIHDIEPRRGALQAEQPVKITGAGFRDDVGYRIYFGSKRARTMTVLDEGTLLATAPARDEEGAVDIMVLADSGEAFRVREGYTYADMVGPGEAAAPEKKGNLAY